MSGGLLEAATVYAQRGWDIVPIPAGEKACKLAGWQHNASRDPAMLDQWFDGGQANLGIATGGPARLLALDIDRKGGKDGFASLAALEAQHGPLPATLTARTPTGGEHRLYQLPPGHRVRSGTAVAPGLDWRGGTEAGEGRGYIVAAPSRTPTGVYQWGDDAPVADAPEWLVALLAAPKAAPAAPAVASGGTIAEGGRNDALFRLASAWRGAGMEPETITAALAAHNSAYCQPPLSEGEVRAIAASAGRYEPNAGPLSDLAMARRLVTRLDGNARYDHVARRWQVWDGLRWQLDATGEVERHAKAVADELAAEAAAIFDPATGRKARAAAARAASLARIRASIDLAASEPGVAIDASAFDGQSWRLNAANGIVDLRTGELLPHDREALHSRMVAVDFDPAAPAPRWRRFVDEVTCGDRELANYLQRALGRALTGDTSDQCFHLLHGIGANGKSLMLATVAHVAGSYAHHAPISLLLQKQSGAASNDVADLQGRRLVVLSEANEGDRVDGGLLKRLTGGEPVTARRLYFEWQTFEPQAAIFWAVNDMPRLDANDAALWRRARVVPFDRAFAGDEQDPGLAATLRAEAAGILAWLVAGACQPLASCEAVERATNGERAEQDAIGLFINEACETGRGFSEEVGCLYFAFQAFANDNGGAAMTPRVFGKALSRRGFQPGKGTGGRRVSKGLRLTLGGAA